MSGRFKTVLRFTLISCIVMAIIDYSIGAQAEFVNAWSVIERIFSRMPAAGNSLLYRKLGAVGELVIVLLINLIIGLVLALIYERLKKT